MGFDLIDSLMETNDNVLI